jgi:hypothetical protein
MASFQRCCQQWQRHCVNHMNWSWNYQSVINISQKLSNSPSVDTSGLYPIGNCSFWSPWNWPAWLSHNKTKRTRPTAFIIVALTTTEWVILLLCNDHWCHPLCTAQLCLVPRYKVTICVTLSALTCRYCHTFDHRLASVPYSFQTLSCSGQ